MTQCFSALIHTWLEPLVLLPCLDADIHEIPHSRPVSDFANSLLLKMRVPIGFLLHTLYPPQMSISPDKLTGASSFQSPQDFASSVFVWLVPFLSTKTLSALQVKSYLIRPFDVCQKSTSGRLQS